MKHLCKKIIICCLVILLCCGCSAQRRKNLEVELRYNGNEYWEEYDMTNTMFPTPEALEKLTEEYILQIEDCLHLYNWWEYLNEDAETLIVNVYFIDGQASYARRLSLAFQDEVKTDIQLSKASLIDVKQDGSLAHELTHTMLGKSSFSLSLEEGICQYTQGRVGPENYVENYGWTWHEHFKCFVTHIKENGKPIAFDEIIASIGISSKEYPYKIDTAESVFWYDYSRSFVEYLSEQYGIEKVVALIQNGKNENDYETYLGKSFDVIKKEWLEYFDSIVPSMTAEEAAKAEAESYETWLEELKNR